MKIEKLNHVSGRSFQELNEEEMQGIFGAGEQQDRTIVLSATLSSVKCISLSVAGTVSYISGIHSYEVQCLG